MKKIVALFMLLTMILTCFSALAESVDHEAVFTHTVSGKSIKLGMTQEEVEGIVGGITKEPSPMLTENGLVVEVHGDISGMAFRDDILVYIRIEDGSWVTEKGIHVGASLSDLIKTYALQEIKRYRTYNIGYFVDRNPVQYGLADSAPEDFQQGLSFNLDDQSTIIKITCGDFNALTLGQ